MDQLPAFGTAIADVVGPTFRIYTALLQPNKDYIKSTTCKTFSYGADARQNLDVYYPSSHSTNANSSILIFLYGGGLSRGSKTLPMVANGLVYANLGHFFAEKCGFVVVIPDYRLVPSVQFPAGGEDLSLVVDWIQDNIEHVGGSGSSPRGLYIMGNSAGGIHMSTYLFLKDFASSRSKVLPSSSNSALKLKGAVFLSVPFHFKLSSADRADTLKSYYGSKVDEHCPLGLLEALKQNSTIAETLPTVKFLALTGSLDPDDEILVPNKDFVEAWNTSEKASDTPLKVEVMDGHNHISPPLSVGTAIPREEAWATQMAEFCKD